MVYYIILLKTILKFLGGSPIQQVNVPNNKIDQDLQSSSDTSIFSKVNKWIVLQINR